VRVHARFLLIGLMFCGSLLIGCASSGSPGPYSELGSVSRRTTEAEALTREAAALIDTNPSKAESMLRRALELDLFHGPAHNNLGVVFLNDGLLYEAAEEFEWARKLMPGHPDPRVNLGMTLELAGRHDEAMERYTAALEVYPEHIGAIQAAARLQLRRGETDDRTLNWLSAIALRGESESWRTWAISASKTISVD